LLFFYYACYVGEHTPTQCSGTSEQHNEVIISQNWRWYTSVERM